MNILYYAWKEYTFEDATETLRNMGNVITFVDTPYSSFDEDELVISSVKKKAKESHADIIFSFNYFPDLSRCADELSILYVCWCFDSPLLTLESKTLSNPCNKVFLFDRALFEKYKASGISTVYHLPLACNVVRLEKQTAAFGDKIEHDITFLGNMYDDEEDFYGRIKYLPDYIRGYVDCAMQAQMSIFGMDMIGELIDHDMCNKISDYAKFDLGPLYNECRDNIIRFMIQKHTTVIERARLMTVISENFNVDHYGNKKSDGIKAKYKGYADYMKEMPRIFATSKINLNITLRSIISGIPLRVIDILGTGGFCLTNYQSEIAEYFVNGESIVWYECYEDLFEKLSYYINNDTERERIARNGHDIVAKEFGYERRFREMFSKI